MMNKHLAGILVGAVFAISGLSTVAQADQGAELALVIPLESELGEGAAIDLARFDGGLADSAAAVGWRVQKGVTTVAEIATLSGCAEPSDTCLSGALAILGVDRIIYGQISPGEGAEVARITLVVIAADGVRRDSIGVAAGDDPVVDAAWRLAASRFLKGEEKSSPPPPAAAATADVEDEVDSAPAPAPVAPAAGFSLSKLSPRTRWTAAGGAGALVVGFLLYAMAADKQGDIDSARVDTVADLEHLESLESTGKTYALAGNIFVIGGLAAVGTAAYWGWREGRSIETRAALVPLGSGGASLVVSRTFFGW